MSQERIIYDRQVLDFERPIVDLERKIEELKQLQVGSVDFGDEIRRLEKKARKLQQEIFAELSPWQKVQLSRHPARPYTLDYIQVLFDDFVELHGDRAFADDESIVGGMARFAGREILVIGHQKGRNTKQNLRRNFGMSRPEGYRKARRLMQLAARFRRPILTFIDTPGAYPGIGAEERGQAEAIAKNLEVMSTLRTPIVTTVIGEGGSGGALALGVGDRIIMLEYAIYSVISPEGCASILWKDQSKVATAAEELKLTAPDLRRLGICDEIVNEGPGGAHRDLEATAALLRAVLTRHLSELCALDPDKLIEQRYRKFRAMGVVEEVRA
ncbi:MAG: acetyl-CoA carboxylase carboxyltransferase subunit alpha [Deltaproteobacteria bacterium]|nr:acetyl-CoA carboxylase carboxyltransferase subunit alpha [Deltaproteobacteria bacterium]